jgi:proline racemase
MLELERVERAFTARPGRIVTLDSHTQGEPTRLLISSTTDIKGATMAAMREDFQARHDQLRCLVTREPRGHRGMFAAALTEPVSPGAHFGLVFMDARRYPYLCGHGTIGAVTTLIETGVLEAPEGESVIIVDTPSGPLKTYPEVKGGRVVSVSIDMVPSFVLHTDTPIEVEGFGRINIDLVCVGGFFAMVPAAGVGLDLVPENSDRLTGLGMAIIDAANRGVTVTHPERPEVATVDVTEFYAEDSAGRSGTSAVVYGESHLDRSPCGTGTTAKMTLMYHKNSLAPGEVYRSISPLGTVFEGRIVEEIRVGDHRGIIGRIKGSATLTGYHQFVIDPEDPFQQGFLL